MSDQGGEHPLRRESDFAIQRVEKTLESLNNVFQRRENDLGRINQKLDDAIEYFKAHVEVENRAAAMCQAGFIKRFESLENKANALDTFRTKTEQPYRIFAGIVMASATAGIIYFWKLLLHVAQRMGQ